MLEVAEIFRRHGAALSRPAASAAQSTAGDAGY